MKWKKRIVQILITILVILLVAFIAMMIDKNKSRKILNNAKNLYNSSDTNIIYIGRPNCYYCQKFTPVMDNLKDKYHFEYTYINMNKLIYEDFISLLNLFDIDPNDFGTPCVIITKDGKVIARQDGYTDELNAFFLLQDFGFISSDIQNPYLVSDDNKVVSNFNEVFSSNEKQIVYFEKLKCDACNKMKKNFDELNISYYSINVDEITESEFGTIIDKLNIRVRDFKLPYLVITKNGNKEDEQPGYIDKTKLEEFINKNYLTS